jgi:amino acid adenylation domain-containing protein
MSTYPLSQAQLSIFLACQGLDDKSGNYQLPALYKLPAGIDTNKLAAALEAVVKAHPALNSRIVLENGTPRFEEAPAGEWKTGFEKVASIDDVRKDFGRPMDLLSEPLCKAVIWHTDAGDYLYLDFHHIVFDGLSISIFLKELDKAYRGEAPEAEKTSMAQIALREEKLRGGDEYQEAQSWFADNFAPCAELESTLRPDVSDPQQDAPHVQGTSYSCADFPVHITRQTVDTLRDKYGCSESTVFSLAFGLTLSAWNADTKAWFPTVWNGRVDKDTLDTVSMCVHTLPVYVEWTPGMELKALFGKMKEQAEGVRKRHFYSFADCTRDLGLSVALCFGYQGQMVGMNPFVMTLGDAELTPEDLRTNPPGIGLPIELFATPGGEFQMRFWYQSDKYSKQILGNFTNSFSACLNSMASADTVEDLAFSSPEQMSELDSFNPGPCSFDTEVTLLDLFRKSLAADPGHTAIVYKDKSLTYKQVDQLSDKLAAYISGHVEPGSVVSIILDRNEYMMVAPLGVMKAGCAYQPLDPSYPEERLDFMVQDSAAALLIADPGLDKLVGSYNGPKLCTSDIPSLPDGRPDAAITPDDLLILLYTSGTTGKPKGCMLSQRNVSNYVCKNKQVLGVDASSRLIAYASFGFDAFLSDLYTSIAAGATLYVIPEEIRLDLIALDKFFTDNSITHVFMTTQVATQFALNFPQAPIKCLYTGGEKMASIPLPEYKLFNCYGPTESVCYVIYKQVVKQEPDIPIGRPVDGIHAYVVSKSGQRVPAGAAGELLVAGKQVGMGYLNRPDKTAEVFIANRYENDELYKSVYSTGDIVRYRPDGDIEFIGRKDSQVKIRGFRIELKEVETVIREFPGITDVTVQAFDEQGTGGGKFLAAYIVSPSPVDIDALKAFIFDRKPPYMVPAVIMQIEAIPLNVNQKVDRKALPEPKLESSAKTAEAAPLNILEQELSSLIAESAHVEGFSLTDPLFYYGLTSLSALRLATELYKRYGISVNMDTFVKTATLQSIENDVLSTLMLPREEAASEVKERSDGPRPLTYQQEGVYFDCMKAPHETVYNIPVMWTLPAGLDAEKVRDCVLGVLKCHPYINTHFEMIDGKVMQVPTDKEPEVELLSIDETELEGFKTAFTKPFNLSEGPLYRVAVVQAGGGLYLFTDFHHTIFDGRSYDIFMTELTAAVDGKEPSNEAYSYFDYASDQKEAEEGEEFAAARDFFNGQMAGCEGASGILPDLEKGDGPGREASLVKAVSAKVSERCRSLGISPASYFLSAAFLAAGAFSGSKKVYICTISNGRSDLRTSDTLGMFVNTLALASDTSSASSAEYLKQTDDAFSQTRAHENYPFAKVASDFDFQPQIMLAYQVGVLEEYRINGEAIKSENLESSAPKFPVSIFIEGKEGEEVIHLQYDDSLYSKELMQSFADTMENIASVLASDCSLDGISLINPAQAGMLDGFNSYSTPVDSSRTIVSLFKEQAARNPEALAVSYQDKQLSYGQLDAITDRIAAYITSLGLGREDVVSVLIGRSEMMPIASLGVLKAGCAYQPLDPSYPQERLNFMIQDADAKLLIADGDLLHLLNDYNGPVLDTAKIDSLPEGPLPEGPLPESLFILLYTSGSTGVPKGCMLEHRNLVNFCTWYREYYDLTPDSRVAAYASYGFDACMMDMYPALTTGASVHIIPEETRHDMSAIDKFITSNGITHSFMTTQVGVMFAQNYPDNPSLKHLSVGGEKLVSINPPSYAFHNGYGPTECTIFSTIFDVQKKEANIPIGHPLSNLKLYVADSSFRRLPAGAVGELWISGPQVGRGYLKRPDKTAETYIPNPFETDAPYDRVYRTGDIVRYRMDGNVEFVGRRDGQVKIRGFRVETKEVEAVIREFPGVKDVTVQPFDSPSGGKFIAAYVVIDGPLDTKALSSFILQRKPPYMVPAAFMKLEQIPLNVNQKVDRKVLPAPVMNSADSYVEPSNDTERALCEIFAQVLGMDRTGVTDNFFDLGGSSLMVTNVLVNAERKDLHFSYGDVFAHPTARELAAFLTGQSPVAESDDDVAGYDYSAINKLLAGNTLENFIGGERQELGKNILLTGTTGFLGIHMLREVLDQTPSDTVIWCLLRGKGAISAERRLTEMLVYYFGRDYMHLLGSRIRVIQGDITDGAVFASMLLSGTPYDTVINCAANVKHFSRGNDILKVNYEGVKNIVDFCIKRGAMLIQVSTESVGGMAAGESPMLTEQMLYFGQNTDNQYVFSKFMAERYILENVAGGKLNAKIMRAGNLSPRAADGEFQINFNTNASMGRLKSYRILGACPYSLLEAKMEFSPIDETAKAVVLLARTPKENCVFNVSNNHLIPMDDIVSRLKLGDGSSLEYLEDADFFRRMEEAKSDPKKAKILSSIIAYDQADGQLHMVEPSTAFTMQILHRLGFRWDQTNSRYVDMIFEVLDSFRFFDTALDD